MTDQSTVITEAWRLLRVSLHRSERAHQEQMKAAELALHRAEEAHKELTAAIEVLAAAVEQELAFMRGRKPPPGPTST